MINIILSIKNMIYSGLFKTSRILPAGYIPTEGNISLCAALYIWLNEPSYIITVKYIDGEFNEIFFIFFLYNYKGPGQKSK